MIEPTPGWRQGVPALAQNEAQALLNQVYFFCFVLLDHSDCSLAAFVAKSDLCDRPLSLFFRAFIYCDRLVCWGVKLADLQKVEMVVAGSEAGGLYRLLRGVLSHSPMSTAQPPTKSCHQAPTTTVSKLPP